jgi:hypothetical protein
MAEKLTDRTAKTSSFANDDVVHVVDVSDTSQDPAGSSFKSALGDIYGSYLAPKITSAQIVTNAADTYSLTLSDSSSSNHYLFLQTDSGDPFVDVTVTSYASPKDGAILVIRLNRAGTDDLSIPGFSAGSGFSAGIYTARYSSSAVSWLPVNYLPLDAVQDFTDLGDAPSTYSGQANKVVKVNAAANGLEFGSAIPKVYTALLSATAGVTSVIVLESTIGNIVWVQDPIFGSGKYRGTLAGAFSTSSKFFALTGFKSQTSEYSSIQHMDADSCLFEINVIATGATVDTFTNYIELRIYP